MKKTVAVLMVLGLSLLPVQSVAACGTGQIPSYDDISAVMFERGGCGESKQLPRELKCSLYWTFVTKWDVYDDATYSQFDLPGQVGTYKLAVSLSDARALLQKHDFFNLNPSSVSVTDIRQSLLTVKRCSVVTRVMMYPNYDVDKPTASLFAALDALIARAKKHRVSAKPTRFPYSIIFDGK